ncbi:MAG: flagellar biosynthetic protein FliO [Pseudomonadota bacterium]|uniref:flagellar biosynthetic protein FliO n=1 Tax=Thermithiobacillus tepidarius TaxID=929 RepID=UPI000407F13B|nr:flagellar biosynthetic protein FliO [Thermithiobacillus tepidarius]
MSHASLLHKAILIAGLALAGPAQAANAAPAPASPVSFWNLLQVMAGLAIVLAAVVFAAWALRRLQPAAWNGAGPLRIIAAMPLGARERVLLVQVGEEQVLLGVTSTRISRLHVLAQPVAATEARPADGLPNFPDWLKNALQRRGGKDV